jgi:hypothetical protein
LVLEEFIGHGVSPATDLLVTGELAAAVALAWTAHEDDWGSGRSSERPQGPCVVCKESDNFWKLMGRIEALSRTLAQGRSRGHRR